MALPMRLYGMQGTATQTSGRQWVEAAQKLYDTLHNGFIHSGLYRIPIAGDMGKLPAAHGLTMFQRQLATASKRLGEDLGGTQAVRLRMGSRQFGARMVYGDCLFATISPNEQHSALVLRLSRGRPNDPYVKFADEQRQRLADGSYPSLAAAFAQAKRNVQIATSHQQELRLMLGTCGSKATWRQKRCLSICPNTTSGVRTLHKIHTLWLHSLQIGSVFALGHTIRHPHVSRVPALYQV